MEKCVSKLLEEDAKGLLTLILSLIGLNVCSQITGSSEELLLWDWLWWF